MLRLTTQADRGAVAVVVAVLMVPLLGFAGLAIDVSSMWSQKQRLQVAADASALAIAQDCARHACGMPDDTAASFTTANFGPGATARLASPVTEDTGSVTVTTSAVDSYTFARVLGFSSSKIAASSTAIWGYPAGGRTILPLTFSVCEFLAQTGGGVPSETTIRTIYTTDKNGQNSPTGCTGPSGLTVPGGFGWVDSNAGDCGVNSVISTQLSSDPGASGPKDCTSIFQAYQNKTVLLPIFDDSGGQGTNAWYRVYGYVAFRLTGYSFPAIGSWDNDGCSKCIRGYFTQYVDSADTFTYTTTAPDLGVEIVKLSA